MPGKFSLFPTLAHNVYVEMEMRGVFLRAPRPQGLMMRAEPPPVARSRAERLVAERSDLGLPEWAQ